MLPSTAQARCNGDAPGIRVLSLSKDRRSCPSTGSGRVSRERPRRRERRGWQPPDTYDVRVAHDGRADRPRRTSAPRGQRPDRRESAGRDDRLRRPPEPPRPGLARKENEPPIPEGVDTKTLHRAVRAELRGLPKDLAEIVASHLVVAGELIEEDPELAYAHAEAARRRAARLPIVREATAETAYAAGLYDVALSEFRALRRMTGTHDYLPVMADCERAARSAAQRVEAGPGSRPTRARPGAADRDDHRRGRRPRRPGTGSGSSAHPLQSGRVGQADGRSATARRSAAVRPGRGVSQGR